MTTQQQDDTSVDERLKNVGLVVDKSARLDKTLRNAFCSIIGNKYAAVLADGRSAEWLIKKCRDVLEAHREITGEHRANIQLALDACKSANDQRNDLLYGHRRAAGAASRQHCTTKTTGCKPDAESETWPADKIHELADEFCEADAKLFCAMKNAVSPEVMVIGEALAWERRRERGAPC